MSFADNLRYIMDAQQVNQAQLAKDSGLSVAGVSHICKGDIKAPRTNTVMAISRALHCTVDDLLGRDLPLHIRRWAPNAETCERKLTEHLQSGIGPDLDMANNMAVIERMQSHETQNQAADGVFPAAPVSLPLSDLQALFDACVDDNDPSAIFAQFGKQVYQLMAEAKEGTK